VRRKLSKRLDGLEAGIAADIIASRIAATQREKSAAESVLASAPPTPAPLGLEQVIETLTALRDLPELLGRIEQADRAALYQALELTVRYRRIGSTEEVKLTSTLRSVEPGACRCQRGLQELPGQRLRRRGPESCRKGECTHNPISSRTG